MILNRVFIALNNEATERQLHRVGGKAVFEIKSADSVMYLVGWGLCASYAIDGKRQFSQFLEISGFKMAKPQL